MDQADPKTRRRNSAPALLLSAAAPVCPPRTDLFSAALSSHNMKVNTGITVLKDKIILTDV